MRQTMRPFEQAWFVLKNERAKLRDATIAARQRGRQVPEVGLSRLDGSPRIGGQQNRLMNYPGQTFQPRPSDTYRSRMPETGPVQSQAMDPAAVRAMGSRIQTPEQMNAQHEGMEDDYLYESEGFSQPPKVQIGDLIDVQTMANNAYKKRMQGYIDQALQEEGGFDNFTYKELMGVHEYGTPEQIRALKEHVANKPPPDPNRGGLFG
jgi:hypothetical protein